MALVFRVVVFIEIRKTMTFFFVFFKLAFRAKKVSFDI